MVREALDTGPLHVLEGENSTAVDAADELEADTGLGVYDVLEVQSMATCRVCHVGGPVEKLRRKKGMKRR